MQATSGAEEERRSQVRGVFLETIIQELHEYVQGCVAKLVFKLHKIGISVWEDRKMNKVIARAAMLGQTKHHRLSRNMKHISMISCVSAAGESHIP
jgi:hypothetical protein